MAYTYPNKAKVEKTKFQNLSDYSENKVLFTLTKKHSPYNIKIVEYIPDNWFIHILKYKPKTGLIMDSHFIISPDLKTWLSHLDTQGFKIVN